MAIPPRPACAPIALLAAASLALPGCTNVAPWLERSYVRAGPVALAESLRVDDARESGPFPGIGATLGTLLAIEGTRSVGVEAGIDAYDLDPGELDGYGFRYFGGTRWQWNVDGRLRPTVGVGASWTDFRVHGHERGSDPGNAGAWIDAGVDWMATPKFGLGLRVRESLRYEEADKNHGLVNGVALVLESVWRF